MNITLDTTTPTPNLVHPANNTASSSNSITFTYNVSEQNSVENCSLILNGAINQTNTSIIKDTNQTFNTTLSNGNYNWSVNCTDATNNVGSSGTYNLTVNDSDSPNITLISPANSSIWSSSSTVTFSYNVSDVNSITNCSLLVDGSIDQNDTTITKDTTQEFTKSLSNGNYNWSINCSDFSGNSGNSSVYYLTVSYAAPSDDGNGGGSSSGGGGGGIVPTNTTTKSHFWERITPGVATIMKDFNFEIGIKQIQIRVHNEAQNVKITVIKHQEKPANISVEKSGKVYQYLQINEENLNDKLDSAVVEFRINKTWLSNNSLEKENISVFRYNETEEKWKELETIYTGEDGNYSYHSIELDSFSYFVIGEKGIIDDDEIGTDEEKEENRFVKFIRNYWAWILLLVGIVVIVVLTIYLIQRYRKGLQNTSSTVYGRERI